MLLLPYQLDLITVRFLSMLKAEKREVILFTPLSFIQLVINLALGLLPNIVKIALEL